jgi:hypothetical protein
MTWKGLQTKLRKQQMKPLSVTQQQEERHSYMQAQIVAVTNFGNNETSTISH